MQEKKRMIIEASIDLFAERGFHETSVQQIVDEAHVAKGSFYNYFTSKNDLLRAIYDYYYTQIEEAMAEETRQASNATDSFTYQLDVVFHFLLNHKALIQMVLKEQVPIDRDMEWFMTEVKQQHYYWLEQNIQAIQGEAIKPYLYDVVVMTDGLIHSYMNWLLIDEDAIDLNQLPHYLTKRIYKICQDVISEGEPTPIKQTPQFLTDESLLVATVRQYILNLDPKDRPEASRVLTAIENELNKPEPESVVIDSLLINLEQYDAIRDDIQELRDKRKG
ncbi:TetR/AcrR family transcriptional regulator [Alkalibacillus sp. S2W]|uniref:TetR/AcrR family transcriptional regulator n=1 Tax=Alkalibacillus sp. S2W TaxID=3386553 RepID=UPI00398CBDD9